MLADAVCDMTDLEQLMAHVRYRIGGHAHYAQRWRIDELTGLLLAHYPHSHLRDVMPKGRNHRDVQRAMALARAQVREQWELRHGVGPLWNVVLAPALAAIWHVLLDLWESDPAWAERLEAMGRTVRHGGNQ